MDIIFAALFAVVTIIAYVAVIQRERIILQTSQIDALTWQVESQTQRADALCKSITAHLEAKQGLLDEMDKLQARNNWLEHKRSGRNAPSMRSGVYGHHRGHSA